MAAYAALVSLMNLIDQIHHHPQAPITLDKDQTRSLTKKIAFLQDFLEAYNSHYSKQEVEPLRIRIADAAYAAEDVIESHIVNQILARRDQTSSANLHKSQQKAEEDIIESRIIDQVLARRPVNDNKGKKKSLQKVKQYFGFVKKYVTKCNSQSTSYGEKTSSADLYQSQQKATEDITESTSTRDADEICSAHLYQGLQKVLEEMDFIKKEVEEIKEKLGTQEQLQRIMTTPVVSSKSPSTQHNIMVGFDDVLNEMLHKLTGQPCDRQIIPISGMGGIGKTTLARNLYTNPLIEHHFHVLAWVTVSQEYNIREILLEVLHCQNNQGSRESLSQMSYAELGEKLYKSLYGRSYLVVMDDMWSDDVWDKVKFYFPSNDDGSRIIVTTRLSNLASYLTSCYGLEMNFIDQDKSWTLLCKTVFGEQDCPLELEHIGIEIARNCKGLPLSILVLGGLLAKSNQAREYWEYIAENLNSIVNLEDHERCLKILHTSYDELPVHLKACFLYMGTFPEDSKIRVSKLINMWVAEGFLKPISGKSLEESAEEYLMNLIDRNLILVSKRGYSEKVVFCSIHDLLRDLCIREARKEKFLLSANQHGHNTPYEGINTQRRIVVHQNTSEKEYLHTLKSTSVARSLICYFRENLPLVELKLLRVLKRMDNYDKGKHTLEAIFQQVNLRYLAVQYQHQNLIFPSSVSLLWNLQTLIIYEWICGIVAPPDIWKMPLLRHVESNSLRLPDPPSGHTDRRDDFVLHNLHTLLGIVELKFGEEVVKRIPNVKKLELRYVVTSNYCLYNLGHLYKLESLTCILRPMYSRGLDDLLQNLIFPHSLKELSLCGNTTLNWEDINTKIGSLPHLQVLKLKSLSFTRSEWETTQGQFCSLKYLLIGRCTDWEYWTAESTHFPRLEHLVLKALPNLKEIPSGIGDIPTLKSIQLMYCNNSVIISAKQIVEEQEEVGNEGLQVTVVIDEKKREEYQHLENLASRNFQVKFKKC